MTSPDPLSDWRLGADGVRERDAARVIVLRSDGRALLVRGHDLDQPERSWWFTIGGGIDPGEDAEGAALRELAEETGLELSRDDLLGPIVFRTGIFDFYRMTCRQYEQYFLAYVTTKDVSALSQDGWTSAERDVLDELQWLSPDELRSQAREYFPAELPDILDAVRDSWNGYVWRL